MCTNKGKPLLPELMFSLLCTDFRNYKKLELLDLEMKIVNEWLVLGKSMNHNPSR